jgi:pimeloyl-ACP methyl ester carboxylesterase
MASLQLSAMKAVAPGQSFLSPQRIASYRVPAITTTEVAGTEVSYVIEGPENAPLILYFHGWGDDYRGVLPLEYPLVDDGFRLLVMHRPGYVGTKLEGYVRGKKVDRRTSAGTAHLAASLLDKLHGRRAWQVKVIGTSGGAPAALSFASLYPRQTTALIIQAGVTQPWTDAKFVPDIFRSNYVAAFQQFGWAGGLVSEAIFGLLVKLRENLFQDEDKIKALVGTRLDDARRDPAFGQVLSKILQEDAGNSRGELNDAHSVFFSRSPYCVWERITARSLIIHDRIDPFVPFAHAKAAKELLPSANLAVFELAGHVIWLGRDARRMHQTRNAFLKASA